MSDNPVYYKARQIVHRRIARRIILDALKAGYSVNLNNGGDENELPEPATKLKPVLDAMFATDEEHLLFYKDGKRAGWAYLIYCNSGWDVLADYTTNLEEVMKGANELADKIASDE